MCCSLVKSVFVFRHKADSRSFAQTLPLYNNASVRVVTESAKGIHFLLIVFSKLAILRTKVPFNKSEVIVFNCTVSSIHLSVRFG